MAIGTDYTGSCICNYCCRDPNKEPGELPLNEWPVYKKEERKYLRLHPNIVHGYNEAISIGIGPKIQECAFWNRYLPNLVQATGK